MLQNKKEGGVFAPGYYSAFSCIADRCRHSCCIGWEIGIDGETYEKYQQLPHILRTVTVCEDGPCFSLRADGRCPHLNDAGLCDIILSHGEAYLSEICRNHPRFFHVLANGRIEAGLGIVCEEACRLILATEEPFSLSEIEDCWGDEATDEADMYDAWPIRDEIIAIIEGAGRYDEKAAILKSKFRIPARFSPAEWSKRFLALEILDPNWENDMRAMQGKLFCDRGDSEDEYRAYYQRLLIYFVYRHVSVAQSENDLSARLAFALLSVEVIRSLFAQAEQQDFEQLIDRARRYSAEIEYSEENTAELIFALERSLLKRE